MKLFIILILSIFTLSCNSQDKKENANDLDSPTQETSNVQIGEYVTSVYEDTCGHLWFGTLQKGIAKYDGEQLKYFTKKDGLPSDRVTSVTQDGYGAYWFNTGEGLSRFDGILFTNYRVKDDDFGSNTISSLLIDSNNQFWVGTWGGVYKFDGKNFTPFQLPVPEIETPTIKDTKKWITEIREDIEGNIWFARDGYGACKYDGQSFTHYLKKDGFLSNNIMEVVMDDDGGVWFGSRVSEQDDPDPTKRTGKGGINKLSNDRILSFPEIDALSNDSVYEIYKATSGDIWVCTQRNGVYQYNGETFKHYPVPISVMGMTYDQRGMLWLAGAGGLYRIDQNSNIINVTVNGPWK